MLRRGQGWSQERLSEKTGISVQHISNMENGHKEVCLENIAKLAKQFGLSVAGMLEGL